MTKLDELMAKFCPNGVEYKELKDIAKISRGIRVVKKELAEKGKYPVYQNSMTPLGYYDKYNCPSNTTFIISAGAAGEIGYSYSEFWAADDCLYFICSDYLISRYLYHYLLTKQNFLYSNVRKASVPRLSRNVVEKIKIPVPPLEVQREIVRILDNFTELTTELTTELAARKKQYEYYRDMLLNFDDTRGGIYQSSLGEVCETVTDYVAAGSFASIAQNVRYNNNIDYAQLIRTVDIKNKFRKADSIYVDKRAFDFLWRVNLDKECIVMPNIGVNCGEIYYITPQMLPYKHNVLGPNAIMVRSSSVNNKFLSYLFQCPNFQKKLKKIISPGGQTKFNKTELKKLKLQIPPLSEQNRIVKILDRFDALTNDLTEGLPAEIAARRAQYEYYRDKLLSFEEVK